MQPWFPHIHIPLAIEHMRTPLMNCHTQLFWWTDGKNSSWSAVSRHASLFTSLIQGNKNFPLLFSLHFHDWLFLTLLRQHVLNFNHEVNLHIISFFSTLYHVKFRELYKMATVSGAQRTQHDIFSFQTSRLGEKL